MKAVVYEKYGTPGVLHLSYLPKPKPRAKEILVKVIATCVSAGDVRIRAARFPKGFALPARMAFGLFRPRRKVLGMCFSGIVDAVGSEVKDFTVGDEVCGMTGVRMGTYAEYVAVKAGKSVVNKPEKVTHEQAAGMLFGSTAALYFLRDKGHITRNYHVAINGAAGAVGSAAVQIAKYFGADVTAVVGSEQIDTARALGASRTIDYTKTSIFDTQDTFDLVLDTVGNITAKNGAKLLKPHGKLLLMVASLGQMIRRGNQVAVGTATENAEDIQLLLNMVEKGQLKPLIDSVYNLDQIVDAHSRAEEKGKCGAVVVKVA
jgi:NADPH:quinone reductase-like Zn-dependent oxidoreductase